MVASIGVIASPSQGVSYYEKDGCYARDDPAHREASAWAGKEAGELGLSGSVDPETRVKTTLTKRSVDALAPADRPFIAWDDRLTGFGVRVRPSGVKTVVVKLPCGRGRTQDHLRKSQAKGGGG